MAQKFVHKVDNELAGDAQYRAFANIETSALTAGSTIQFMPGVYEMGTANVDNLTLQGVGNAADVILANMILGTGTANTVIFENLTLSGNSPAAASTARSLFVTAGTTATLRFKRVRAINGDFGIDNQAGGVSMYLEYCDFSGVDRAIRSNAVSTTEIMFSKLNGSSNAYFTAANTTADKGVITIASYSAGSNTGTTTETVRALIS